MRAKDLNKPRNSLRPKLRSWTMDSKLVHFPYIQPSSGNFEINFSFQLCNSSLGAVQSMPEVIFWSKIFCKPSFSLDH
jgi:hypothetical protein